jgi:hypothetical protein
MIVRPNQETKQGLPYLLIFGEYNKTSGTDVMIFKNIFAKKFSKNWRF